MTAQAAMAKRRAPVRRLVEWAFADECAELELDDSAPAGLRPRGHGLEWILIQRAHLGVEVDGGGRTARPHDADTIAGLVAALPRELGGRRMAIRVAELARARREPDWMPGAEPRVTARTWKRTRHGVRAATEVCGVDRVLRRGRMVGVERRMCPITWDPHPREIEAAREDWARWVAALAHLRRALLGAGLERWEPTETLPPAAPWKPEAPWVAP